MKKKRKVAKPMIEVTRSFSFKRNLGNYQMADYFCSAKKECKESEMAKTSDELYTFCRAEVIRSINRHKGELENVDKAKSKDIGKEDAQMDAGQIDFGEPPEINQD
jgi:hypothetical protein